MIDFEEIGSWNELFESLRDVYSYPNGGPRNALIRAFSIARFAWANASAKLSVIPSSAIDGAPIFICRFFLKSGNLLKCVHQITSSEDGGMSVVVGTAPHLTVPGNYVCLFSPIDGHADEPAIRSAFNRVLVTTSMLRAICGHNLLWASVFDRLIDFDKPDNWATDMYSIRKLPQKSGGPFVTAVHIEHFQEVHSAVCSLSVNERPRIQLAIEYFDKAMDDEEPFFGYWIAYEILCDGRRHEEIIRRLRQHYGFADKKETLEKLGLKALINWRHDFTHRGLKPKIEPDIERYMQCMFVDLLRNELKLTCRGNMLNFAAQADLSSIGMANNNRDKGDTLSMRYLNTESAT